VIIDQKSYVAIVTLCFIVCSRVLTATETSVLWLCSQEQPYDHRRGDIAGPRWLRRTQV